jgi:predicted N-acetyltransferase YhbS
MNFHPNLFFVGLLDGKVIGSIMVGYEGHRGWINYLVCTPENRMYGYGRKLVQKAINELKKMGCQSSVVSRNSPFSSPLYMKLS